MSAANMKPADLAGLLGEDRLLCPEEVAQLLHRTVKTLAQWRCQGRGPRWTHVEGRVAYKLGDLRRFVNGGSAATMAEG